MAARGLFSQYIVWSGTDDMYIHNSNEIDQEDGQGIDVFDIGQPNWFIVSFTSFQKKK